MSAPGNRRKDPKSWHLSFLDAKHPALGPLADPSLYSAVLVHQLVRMAVDPEPCGPVLIPPDKGQGETESSRCWSSGRWSRGRC